MGPAVIGEVALEKAEDRQTSRQTQTNRQTDTDKQADR